METVIISSRTNNRKTFDRFAILLSAIVISALFGAVLHANAMGESGTEIYEPNLTRIVQDEYRKLCVEPGDTLWAIAKEYKDPAADIRSYIDQIKKVNQLESATLQAGQVLLLP